MSLQQTYSFLSADKVSKIHCRKWVPDSKPVAVLQIVHGMVEYIERYNEFANFMCQHGFLVVGHDHIGHGESVDSSEEWGIMLGKHPSDVMVEDIFSHYTMTKKDYSDIPYFIMGHSMGSYMTRKFLSVKSGELSGLSGAIIMGTGTEANAAINAGLATIGFISMIHGKDYRSTFVRDMTYGAPYKKYDCYGNDFTNSWLSKNVENVEAYYNDPKCTFLFSLNGYKGLVEATKYDNNPKHIDLIRKDLPIFFVSGEDDPVGNLGKGVIAAKEKFEAAGIKDVSIKLYPGDRHEILNELDRQDVYRDIYQWILSKMS